ncbi:MAG TPA: diacylglycerol kinase family lipid kinase [Sorangium sp.]|nr:diacylglycerol kinase family lipid kinase [Sorangium sp.]
MSAPSKPLVILNPHSQGGRTAALADELMSVLGGYLGPLDVTHTSAPRDAVRLAEQAARESRAVVVAVGGDGTIHEVVNGLMAARAAGIRPPKLGILGQGTGGDFRKTLRLEHRLDQYCKAIAGGKTQAVDVGALKYRTRQGDDAQAYFINILSVGMGGLVDEYVANSGRKLGGTVAYLGASFRALINSEVGLLRCTLHDDDGAREVAVATRTLAICNGQFFGGGMQVAPMASLHDGYFDVVSLGAASRTKFALASMKIYSGSHIGQPDVQVWRCKGIDIDIKNNHIRDKFPLDVDGEPLGLLPISVEVMPAALEVFANA